MSQHDFNIANQTFPSFRSDLNDALQASATMSAGSSAPTTPYAYQLWFDTTTDTWKVRNSGNTAWISTITTDLATGNLDISGTSGATLKLTSTDTSGANTETLGQIDFVSSDVSGGSAGTQARIKGVYEDNGDSSGIAFLTGASTGSGSPTLNEVMRIRHEGNVLVGTTSYDGSHFNDTSGGGFAVTSAGKIDMKCDGTVANFNRTSTSDGDILYFTKQGTAVGSIASRGGATASFVAYPASGNGAGVGGSVNMIIPASETGAAKDAGVNLGSNSTRWKDLYLSGGVYLGGTGSANKLDDYEEGTFETTITPTISGSVVMSTNRTMAYTKVGRLVTCTGDIRLSSVSSPVGFSSMTLPFAVDNFTNLAERGGISMPVYDGSNWTAQIATFAANNTIMTIQITPAAVNEYRFSFSYFTN